MMKKYDVKRYDESDKRLDGPKFCNAKTPFQK